MSGVLAAPVHGLHTLDLFSHVLDFFLPRNFWAVSRAPRSIRRIGVLAPPDGPGAFPVRARKLPLPYRESFLELFFTLESTRVRVLFLTGLGEPHVSSHRQTTLGTRRLEGWMAEESIQRWSELSSR